MILYHYTSNQNFVSIIESKKLRLSALHLSNDSSEGKYFFELLKNKLFDELNYEGLADYEHHVRNYCEDEGAVGFCFSEDGDLLSQWRAYADDACGVSIGFDKSKLIELIEESKNEFPSIKLDKMSYVGEFRDMKILTDLNRYTKKYEIDCRNDKEDTSIDGDDFLEDPPLTKAKSMDFQSLIQKVSDPMYLYKNPHFSEEKEWRLYHHVYSIDWLSDLQLTGYQSRKDMLIPFANFPEIDFPRDLISEVILGAKNKTPKYVVENFLEKHSLRKFTVKKSEASYR